MVLWLLVYQRLRRSATLQTAVKHLVDSASELCVDNKRLRQQTLSSGAGTYSDGRQRLTPEVTEWFANEVRRSIIATSTPTLGGRRVFVVDGTTMTLAPEKALQAAFPPASNPHGEGVWPVALLVVAHELESGAATQPEIGAMYGPQAVSEVQLAQACFARLPADSIVMADANFGIFSVAWGAAQHEHSFLFRRTEPRFHALRKRATGVGEGDNWKTWSLAWIPSVKDRKTNPDLPTDAVVKVLLHEIVVPEKLTLRKSKRTVAGHHSDRIGSDRRRPVPATRQSRNRDQQHQSGTRHRTPPGSQRSPVPQGTVDLNGRLQSGHPVPPTGRRTGQRPAQTPELHRRLEHLPHLPDEQTLHRSRPLVSTQF